MAGVRNRRAIRWLRSQLPELVASGVISSDNARAIDGYYEHDQPRGNFAFVIFAALGSALVAAGIKIGRASGRGRGEILGGAGSFKKKKDYGGWQRLYTKKYRSRVVSVHTCS